MQPFDAKVLQDRLNELAEVFDKKPVSEKGLTVWFGVLKEFPTEKVCGVLLSWARSHTKFPSPSEVWKAVNEMAIDEREEKAAREKRQPYFAEKSARGAEIIAGMRRLLEKPTLTPKEHWERNLRMQKSGSIGHEWASEILKKKPIDREPGCDDELAA